MADYIEDIRGALEALGCRPKGTENLKAKCPAHADDKPSLSATVVDGRLLLTCFAGCKWDDIFKFLAPLLPEPEKVNIEKDILAIYPYHYASGEHAYDKLRLVDKSFQFRSWSGGKQFYTRGGAPPLAYNLPEIIYKISKGKIVFHVEGEKDVETLRRWGMTGTTPGGVQNATERFWDENLIYFMGANVVLLHDADQPGVDFMNVVGERLSEVTHSLKVVDLPDLPFGSGKDISDWAISHSREELIELIHSAPDWVKPKTYNELLRENEILRQKLHLTSTDSVV